MATHLPPLQSAAADGCPGGHPPALFSGARRRLLRGIDRHVGAAAALGLEEDFALGLRSEEHTSELQSLMRISYAVCCLKNTKHCHYNIVNYHDYTYRKEEHETSTN